MEEEISVGRQQYGGYLVLLIGAIMLVFGGQATWASGWFLGQETADSTSSEEVVGDTLTTVVEDNMLLSMPAMASSESGDEGLVADDAAPPIPDILAQTVANQPLPVIEESSLAPAPNPHTFQITPPNHTFQTYLVERGDTPNIIAGKFDISAETLLGGNPWLSQESNQLRAGTELIILPVDGVLHSVAPGETVESIAEQYQIPAADIIAYESNNLEFPYRLQPETEILVPGAVIGQFYWTAPKEVAGSGGGQQWAVQGTGTYVWPVTGRCVTNFYWYGHPGLDVSLAIGSPVVASDRGTVTWASWASGPYFDYGNLVVINHGNGYETLYAHLNSINVYPGQVVEQGQYIGASGNTGRSSGPHIHFEIRYNDFRDNPLNYLGGSVQDCT
jgi:murein DD-endopeptidase MepM/ murein hydrolase activator NlpD